VFWYIVAGVLVVLTVVSAIQWAREVRENREVFAERIGLDLDGLVALLPEPLRERRYLRFLIAPKSDPALLSVGLVYGGPREGNPANVGLDFDRQTGALVAIHPEGIGLGLK
jgi:hypothetical protein